MIDLSSRIKVIEDLIADGSINAITYAALECRLTIELICYERLALTHSYISSADLKGWQPFKVVKQISEEANELVASEFSLSVSSEPVSADFDPSSIADFEKLEYLSLGKQSGFSIAKLKKVWQGLASVALHIPLPKGDGIDIYGDAEKIRAKVDESIAAFREMSDGNMISTSFGADVSFKCLECGYQIRRKAALLKDHQVINCFNIDCHESYEVCLNKDGEDGIEFVPRKLPLTCIHCNETHFFAAKLAESLRYGESIDIKCGRCNGITKVLLNIVQQAPL